MIDKNFKKRIQAIKEYDAAAKEASEMKGFQNVPDGKYDAKIKGATVGESQNDRLQMMVKMEVINHDEENGNAVTAFMGLEGKSLAFTLATLKRLGYEIAGDDPKELIQIVEDLDKSGLEVSIKVKEGFGNILNSLEEVEGEDSDDEEESEDDEDEEETEESEEEESEDEESEEETAELKEGDEVMWEGKDGSAKTGKVVEILEESNTVRVELKGGKIVRVPADAIQVSPSDDDEVEEEVEVEEEEKPAKKSKKAKDADEDEEAEEEEEEEEKPAKKSTRRVKKEKKVAKRKK